MAAAGTAGAQSRDAGICGCLQGITKGFVRPRAASTASSSEIPNGERKLANQGELSAAIRTALSAEVRRIQEGLTQQLRTLEVETSARLDSPQDDERQRHVEKLQRQLFRLERRRRRRRLEVSQLRQALREVRNFVIDESTPTSTQADYSAEQLMATIRNEREEFVEEKQRLQEQIKEIEELLQGGPGPVEKSDPEKEKLRRSVKQLQNSIISRDQFSCWVCQQRVARTHQDDSDVEPLPKKAESDDDEDEMASIKRQISAKRLELRLLRGESPGSSRASSKDHVASPTRTEVLARAVAAISPSPRGEIRHGKRAVESALRKQGGGRTKPRGLRRLQFSDASESDATAPEREELKNVQFSAALTTVLTEVASGPMRSPRDRIATPYAPDPTLVSAVQVASQPKVQWAEKPAQEQEVAVPVSHDQPMRTSRGRIATGFISAEDEAVASNKDGPSVTFAAKANVQDTPVETGARMRRSRGRISTPFVTPQDALEAAAQAAAAAAKASGRPPKVQFSDAVADAGKSSLADSDEDPGPVRTARGRVSTPFISAEDQAEVAKAAAASSEAGGLGGSGGGPAVHFSEVISIESEVLKDDATMRPSRGRVSTPFVSPEDARAAAARAGANAEVTGPGVHFSDAVSVGDSSSQDSNVPMRTSRGRTATPFISNQDAREVEKSASEKAKEPARFAQAVVEDESIVEAHGPLRTSRGRMSTPFISAMDALSMAHAANEEDWDSTVKFQTTLEDEDVEEREAESPLRTSRDRQATPVCGSLRDLQESSGKAIRFGDADVVDAASVAPAAARPVRERTPTGFVGLERLPDSSGSSAGVRFVEQEEASRVVIAQQYEVLSAASPSPAPGQAKPLKDRKPTKGVLGEQVVEDDGRNRAVSFRKRVSVADIDSLSTPVDGGAAGARPAAGQDASIAEGGGVRFCQEASIGDAASVVQGRARPVRDRTPTGFVSSDVAMENGGTGVRLSDESEAVDAGARGVRFAENAAVVDAASSAPSGARPVRDRTPTGFLSTEDVPAMEAEKGAGVRFAAEDSTGEAASASAPDGRARAVRDRTPTGFIAPEALEEQQGGGAVRFAAEAQVEAAASAAASPEHARPVRNRTPTGFVHAEVVEDPASSSAESRGVRFSAAAASVAEAASSSAPAGLARPVRDRTPTGFVVEDEGANVSFAASPEVLAAASAAAPEGEAQPVVERKPTGFVHPSTLEGRGVRFAGEESVGDAASSLPPGGARSVRDRAPTGFLATEDVPTVEVAPGRPVRFASEEASVGEAASTLPPEGGRPVRDRAPTGFLAAEEMASVDGKAEAGRGVRFAQEASVGDAVSALPASGGRSVRQRTPTGFLSAEEVPTVEGADPGRGGVRFTEEASVGEAASASSGTGRSVRDRTPTGFLDSEEVPNVEGADPGRGGVRFAEEASVGEAASASSGTTRSVRDRTPTGFLDSEEVINVEGEDPGRGGVRFAEEASVGEAASASSGTRRSVRDRTPTGFLDSEEVINVEGADPGRGGVRFAEEASVGEAASASSGTRRSVRDRTPTGFLDSEEVINVEGADPGGVRFAEEASVGEAASASSGTGRSVRNRTPTGFLNSEEMPNVEGASDPGGAAVRFAEQPSVGEAASAASGGGRSVRDRTPTGFLAAEEMHNVDGSDGRGVRFAEGEASPGEAASVLPAAGGRSVRDRTPTGFLAAEEMPNVDGSAGAVRFAAADGAGDAASSSGRGAGVRFTDDVSVGEAASSPPASGGRSVRDRAPTGFLDAGSLADVEAHSGQAEDGTGVRFAEQNDVVAAASMAAPAGHARPVRERTPTGFVVPEEVLAETPQDSSPPTHTEPEASSPGGSEASRQQLSIEHEMEGRGVRFADAPLVGEAASAAAPDGGRPVRDRTPTGFLSSEDVPNVEAAGGVRFVEEAAVGDAASSSAGAQARPLRDRVPTGFIDSETLADEGGRSSDSREIRFGESASVGEAASSAPSQARSIRDRTPTGYLGSEAMEVVQGSGNTVRFAPKNSVAEAASEAAPSGKARSVRDRQATGYLDISEQLLAGEEGAASASTSTGETLGRGVRFSEESFVADAASSMSSLGGRSVRERTPTGYLQPDPVLEGGEGGGGVRFAEATEVHEAASSASADAKSVHSRTPTGYLSGEVQETEDRSAKAKVSFRRRVSTRDIEGRGVSFNEEADVGEASSVSSSGRRSVRDRTPTGFLATEDLPAPEEANLRFAAEDQVVVGEAASASAGGRARSVRDRTPTGYMHPDVFLNEEKDAVRFAAGHQVLDAATEAAPQGRTRPVRDRTPTGFISEEVFLEEDGLGGLHFADSTHQPSIASSSSGSRSLRDRTPTGFIREDSMSTPDRSRAGSGSVRFAQEASFGEASSSFSLGSMRSIRERTPTGFLGLEVLGENLNLPEGSGERSAGSRFRVPTGYVQPDQPDQCEESMSTPPSQALDAADRALRMNLGIRFGAADVQAAGSPIVGELRAVRSRTPTGFICEEDMLGGLDQDVRVRFNEESKLIGRKESISSEDEAMRPCSHTASDGEVDTHSSRPSSCSSRKSRSRMSTPFLSNTSLGFEPSTANDFCFISEGNLMEIQVSEESNSARKPPPRKRRPSKPDINNGCGTVELRGIRLASMESNIERAITERVRLNMMRQARDDRVKLLNAGFELAFHDEQCQIERTSTSDFRDSDVWLHDHRASGAVKDTALLRKTLRALSFFEEFADEAMTKLIEAMEVYEFQDGEKVVRQGDKDGTHFFIVAEGQFVVMKDQQAICIIESGTSFGESVLLLFGQRIATVCARGCARAYGIEGGLVRELLRGQYEERRTSVIQAVDEVLAAKACEMFYALNAYQLQCLYDQVEMCTFENGEMLVNAGVVEAKVVYVIVSGQVVVRCHGVDVRHLPRFSIAGDRSMVFQEDPETLVAQGTVQALVLSRTLLDSLYGEHVAQVLLRKSIRNVLSQHKVFSRMHEDELQQVTGCCLIQELNPGEEQHFEGVRLVACLHGEVEETHTADDGTTAETHCCSGLAGSNFAEVNLQRQEEPKPILLRNASATSAKLAIWKSQDLDSVLTIDTLDGAGEHEDKVRSLKSIFIFQTLAKQQLQRLAGALQTLFVSEGERVFSQGDWGEHFYIIRTGLVNVDISGRRIRTLGMGDYFGERALLGNEQRTADITAAEKCEFWRMDKATFQEVMQGPCLDYLTARIALQDTRLTLEDLQFVRVIGRGGFGVVKMVKGKHTGTRYALKCVRKRFLVERGKQETLVSERSILAEVDHPFIVKFVRSFKTSTHVYLLQELVCGGELLDALDVLGLLNHSQAIFYTGCILLALEFLHARRIAYLDLKSENCLIDTQGYVKLIDFGIARRITTARHYDRLGTPMFMAPEMILGKGYNTVADLWSLGICLYDFVIGELPFAGQAAGDSSDYQEISYKILQAELHFPLWFEAREPRAQDTVSLIRGLLTRDQSKRLGAGFDGYVTLKEHPFFSGLNWDVLLGRDMKPPYFPARETYAEDKEQDEIQRLDIAIEAVRKAVAHGGPASEWIRPLVETLREASKVKQVGQVLEDHGWSKGEFATPPDIQALLEQLQAAREEAMAGRPAVEEEGADDQDWVDPNPGWDVDF